MKIKEIANFAMLLLKGEEKKATLDWDIYSPSRRGNKVVATAWASCLELEKEISRT